MSMPISLRTAFTALSRYKLRTALTLLEVVIGVAAVLTTIAVGSGAQAAIEQKVKAAGTNTIVVKAGNYDFTGQSVPGMPPPGLPIGGGGPDFSGTPFPPPFDDDVFLDDPVPAPPSSPQGDHPWWPTAPAASGLPGQGAATTLVPSDADAIRREIPGVQYVAAGVSGHAGVGAGDRRHFTRMEGTDVELPLMRSWSMRHGRFFQADEVSQAAYVVVLGGAVAQFLFGDDDPSGQEVTLQDQPFTVVGVIGSAARSVRAQQDADAVYIPYTTARKLLDLSHLQTLTVSTESISETSKIATQITRLLRNRHKLGPQDPDDFTVRTQARQALFTTGLHPTLRAAIGNIPNLEYAIGTQMGVTLDRASRTMTILLVSIAAVSLLVGGIGIMNIMLVSVTDRTREIGVRMMVGARSRDVLLQFLFESVALSLAGGLLGIVVGLAASGALARTLQWSTTISPLAIVSAFAVAAAVGVFFGLYPARRAARLDPIRAMTWE